MHWHSTVLKHTVDGRNPAPSMVETCWNPMNKSWDKPPIKSCTSSSILCRIILSCCSKFITSCQCLVGGMMRTLHPWNQTLHPKKPSAVPLEFNPTNLETIIPKVVMKWNSIHFFQHRQSVGSYMQLQPAPSKASRVSESLLRHFFLCSFQWPFWHSGEQ